MALFGEAPYRAVVTHGFFLDAERSKMSKSLGNVIEPQDLIARYGADILRLWVSSLDYRDDMPISEEILARCAEAYRKIRNTARYLISNLYDFDPARDVRAGRAAPAARPLGPGGGARRGGPRCAEAYDHYEFHVVYHTLVNFCATTLSAFYLDIVKDRLYASLPRPRASGGRRRRRSIGSPGPSRRWPPRSSPSRPRRSGRSCPAPKEESVHLARFETLDDLPGEVPSPEAWERLTQLREEVAVMLEEARREKLIGSSLEAAIRADAAARRSSADRAAVGRGGLGPGRPLHRVGRVRSRDRRRGRRLARVPRLSRACGSSSEKAPGRRCDRCWKVTPEAEATGLCDRCRSVLADSARARGGGAAMIGGIKLKESTLYRAAYLVVSLAVLLLDQWTKGIITRAFDVHQSRTVVADLFDITYVRNSGAAFGLFASVDSSIKAILLNSVAVLVFLVVSAYALRSSHRSVRLQVGFALILGGAVGNLLDRVRFGYVVDFLDFSISGHHWPAFNVADSAICIGVGLLFLDMLRNEGEEAAAPEPPAGAGS